MTRIFIGFVFVFATSLAGASEKFSNVEEAVKAIAGKDLAPGDYNASSPTEGSTILGIVFSEDAEGSHGQLFVLDREVAGKYIIVATSKKFMQARGPHHYVEIVESTGRNQFYIQVNHEDTCGIGVDIYRFALIRGVWRVSGLDRSVPDNLTCDVNNNSYEYSANFLTGKVITKDYKGGNVAKVKTKHEIFPVYLLAEFDPEAIHEK
ncbi:MAG: hypothetical protein ACXW1W_14370 [Methylococcaceae bacterium]